MDVKKTNLEQELEQIINKLWEEYEITPNHAEEYETLLILCILQLDPQQSQYFYLFHNHLQEYIQFYLYRFEP